MKIQSIMRTGEFTGKFGVLHKYMVMFEGQPDAVEMNIKPTSPVPQIGEELDGTIETTSYGKKFKRTQSGGFQGGSSNPERQSSIEWQSARRDAVDYCIAKSRLLFDLKKMKEAEEELSGKHIFQVAFYFKGIETGATQLNDKVPEQQVDEVRGIDDPEFNIDEEKYSNECSDEDINKVFK
jgi:hypothetical protein